jgi:hypothetical protein
MSSCCDDGVGFAVEEGLSVGELAYRCHLARSFDEPADSLDLGSHRSGREGTRAQFCRGCLVYLPGLGCAVAVLNGSDVSQKQQDIGVDLLREQCRGQVFVHHGFDSPEGSSAIAGDGNAAPPAQITITPQVAS